MRGALLRYRVIAYVVGVLLVALALVGMPLKYLGGEPVVVATVGPVHGFAYVLYLLASFDLARRAGWSLPRTGAVMLAGTVPLLSFVIERQVTARVRAALDVPDAVLAGTQGLR